jgi:hypothetical protein
MSDAPVRVKPNRQALGAVTDPAGKELPRPIAPVEETDVDIEVDNGMKRVPLGQHVSKLAYPPRPGFVRRWISDLPGRVDRALGAGWSHVKNIKNKTPVKMVTDPSLGMSGRQGFLMELPEELYQEDQKLKQDSLDEVDNAIYNGVHNQEANDKRYNPTFAPNKFEVRRGSGRV